MPRLKGQRGFTLIEIVIGLALATMIVLAVLGLWQKAHEAYLDGVEAADAQQNVRVALDRLTRIIQQAGQNPTAAAGFEAIGEAGDNCLRVRADLRGNTGVLGTDVPDGDTGDADEDIKFVWDGSSRLQEENPAGTAAQDLALDIVTNPGGVPLFQFFDGTGAAIGGGGPCGITAANRANIRLIAVTLTVRFTSGGQTVTRTVGTDIRPRNLS